MSCPNCRALNDAFKASNARHAEVHRQERCRLESCERLLAASKEEASALRKELAAIRRQNGCNTTALIRKPTHKNMRHG